MLCVTGASTTIVSELLKITGDTLARINTDLSRPDCVLLIPQSDRYLLAAGVLHGLKVADMTAAQIIESLSVNLVNVIRICEKILERQEDARICVVGSESGYAGSYDKIYAAAKAGVHHYVMTRATKWPQQLFAVAPPIIGDSGMTRRRTDWPGVLQDRLWITAREVALNIEHHLYDQAAEPLTNAIVRLNNPLFPWIEGKDRN